MDSKEASPSLEHLEQSKEEEQSTRRSTRAPSPDAEAQATEDDGGPEGQGSIKESKHLRQVRGRHRAALTRIFRRAEALMKDGTASSQLENVREDMDSALEALMNTNECLEGNLGEDEKADAAQYVADVRTEKRRIEEKIEAHLIDISEKPQTGPSAETDRGERVEEERPEMERRSPSFGRSGCSVVRRPRSQVSVSSAASRASAEAQISVRLKELRVRQLEQERNQIEQERKLKEQEEQLRFQRELKKAKDEAEAARLEAQLRAEMEGQLNADRRDDFLHEDLGEPVRENRISQRPECTRSVLRFTEPISTQPIRDAPPRTAPSPGLSTGQASWIDQLQPASTPHNTSTASAFTKSIPRLKLPIFSGKPSEWPRWVGLFRALVHDQPSLSDAERMAHLQAAVAGQAQQAIAGMLYDGNLYQHALRTLQDRFGQSQDVIGEHLNSIFSAEPPQEDDSTSLENFQAALHCAVSLMQAQGYEADLYSTENLRRTVIKLPQYLRRKWANLVLKLKPRNPSLVDLDAWLLKQVQAERQTYKNRLSRARRAVENSFGILVTKWAQLGSPLWSRSKPLTPSSKPPVCYNYLRRRDCVSNDWRYIAQGDVDSDDDGRVVRGAWRQEPVGNGLGDIGRLAANKPARGAADLREQFARYFMSLEVLWQNAVKRRGTLHLQWLRT